MLVKKLANQITDFENVEVELNGNNISWNEHKIFDGGIITKHFYYRDGILQLMIDYDTLVIYNENIPLSAGYYKGYIRDGNVENGFDFHIVDYYSDLPDLAVVAEGETYVVIKDDNLHRSGIYEATKDIWKFIACLAPSDHGSLSGLSDDDHPQYLTPGRADTRYYRKDEYVTGVVSGVGPVKTDNNGKIGPLLVNNIPHSTFTELDRDDHTQYIHIDGRRGMNSDYTPDSDTDIATKKYVDTKVADSVGQSESKVKVTENDTTPRYLAEAIATDVNIIKEIENAGDDEYLSLRLSNDIFRKSVDTLDNISDGATYKRGLPVDETNTNAIKNKMISNAMAYNWNQSIQNNTNNIQTNTNNIDYLEKHTKYADIFIQTQEEFDHYFGNGEYWKSCEDTAITDAGWNVINDYIHNDKIPDRRDPLVTTNDNINISIDLYYHYIRKSSVIIRYTFNGVWGTTKDDGNGNILPTDHIISGSIDYTTGKINIVFDSGIDSSDLNNFEVEYDLMIKSDTIIPSNTYIYIKSNPQDGLFNLETTNSAYWLKQGIILSDNNIIEGDNKTRLVIKNGVTNNDYHTTYIKTKQIISSPNTASINTTIPGLIELNTTIGTHINDSGLGTSTFSTKISSSYKYKKQSLTATFTITDTSSNTQTLQLTDDGNGNIIETSSTGVLISGTFDYNTGDLSITIDSNYTFTTLNGISAWNDVYDFLDNISIGDKIKIYTYDPFVVTSIVRNPGKNPDFIGIHYEYTRYTAYNQVVYKYIENIQINNIILDGSGIIGEYTNNETVKLIKNIIDIDTVYNLKLDIDVTNIQLSNLIRELDYSLLKLNNIYNLYLNSINNIEHSFFNYNNWVIYNNDWQLLTEPKQEETNDDLIYISNSNNIYIENINNLKYYTGSNIIKLYKIKNITINNISDIQPTATTIGTNNNVQKVLLNLSYIQNININNIHNIIIKYDETIFGNSLLLNISASSNIFINEVKNIGLTYSIGYDASSPDEDDLFLYPNGISDMETRLIGISLSKSITIRDIHDIFPTYDNNLNAHAMIYLYDTNNINIFNIHDISAVFANIIYIDNSNNMNIVNIEGIYNRAIGIYNSNNINIQNIKNINVELPNSFGSGVYITSGNNINISNISNITTETLGAAVFIHSGNNIDINNITYITSDIENGFTKPSGGVIYLYGGNNININNISNNQINGSIDVYGGGVFIFGPLVGNIKVENVVNNTSKYGGGCAIWTGSPGTYCGYIELRNITQNNASIAGGGLYVLGGDDGSGPFDFSPSLLSGMWIDNSPNIIKNNGLTNLHVYRSGIFGTKESDSGSTKTIAVYDTSEVLPNMDNPTV